VPAPCSQALDPNPGSPSCESARTRCSARPRCSPRSCCSTDLPPCGTDLPSPQPPAPVTSQTSASARLDHFEPISAQPGLEIVDPQAGAAIHRPVQGGSCPMPVSAGAMIHRRGLAFPSPAPGFPQLRQTIPHKDPVAMHRQRSPRSACWTELWGWKRKSLPTPLLETLPAALFACAARRSAPPAAAAREGDSG